ncbi:hypothetical protein Pyn_37356 [Prunus yedoensis var. nudiflora]|uniref:Uncharacterized protein n=1 Tax=Prunus yedoensis var. nudiflora TaxID=2094558 RepID=A0A314ZKE7_PRUYE|nr:hypothetical protein Pyn_37356 [Prunus yedoensis var. nudiflora]
MASSRSTFRDESGDNVDMDRMYDAAEQMGDNLPVGLGGNFEYQGARRGGERWGCG